MRVILLEFVFNALKVGNEAIILNIRDILKQVKSRESNISTQVQKRARSRTFRRQNSIDCNTTVVSYQNESFSSK